MNLKDKTCLVTGGTRGIGAATALALAREGGNIALVGRHLDAEAAATKQAIVDLGRRCEFFPADCGDPAQAAQCVEDTVALFGSVDVLIHAAGGPVPGGLLKVTPEEWQAAFNVHVHPIFYMCRKAIPHMQARKEGAIILVSSTAGKLGIITNVAYQVVKGALPQFARALAYEFAADNIRVNCVMPGVIRTRFHANMTEQQKRNNLENRIPLKREGTSEQVATAILELVKNDYITGESLTVDGGLTMRIA